MLEIENPILIAAKQNNLESLLTSLKDTGVINSTDTMGSNALFYAVLNQNLDMISQLIQSKININNQNQVGQTALHLAVIQSIPEIIHLLLKNGADMNLSNSLGFTPVSSAVQNQKIDILKIFEAYGLDDRVAHELEKIINESNTYLLVRCEEVCAKIFSKGSLYTPGIKELFNELENDKKNAFIKNLEVFLENSEKIPEFANSQDHERFNFLISSDTWSNQFLFDNKKRFYPALLNLFVKSANQAEFHKQSILYAALEIQDLSLFMTIMFISYHIKEHTDKYAFFKALSEVKNLNFNEQNNVWGNTFLHFMISNAKSMECVEFIRILTKIDPVNRCHLDVNVLSSVYGTSPLHLAVAKGYRDLSANGVPVLSYLDLVETLLQAGGDANQKTKTFLERQKWGIQMEKIETPSEQTPLHIACARRDLEMIEILMRYGADPTLTNAAGKTPFELLHLPKDERKKIVESISGRKFNNFEAYENTHASQAHLLQCEEMLKTSKKKLKM